MKAKILALTLAALLPPAFSHAANLFPNGDFEEGNREWSRPWNVPAGIRPEIAEGVSRDARGRRCLSFTLKEKQMFFLKSPYVYWPFVKGYPFPSTWRKGSLSFAVKSDRVPVKADGPVIFRVIFCGSQKEEVSHDVVVKPEERAKDWKEFSVSFPIPAGYPEARFEVIGPKFETPLTLYLDDFFFGDEKNGETVPSEYEKELEKEKK